LHSIGGVHFWAHTFPKTTCNEETFVVVRDVQVESYT